MAIDLRGIRVTKCLGIGTFGSDSCIRLQMLVFRRVKRDKGALRRPELSNCAGPLWAKSFCSSTSCNASFKFHPKLVCEGYMSGVCTRNPDHYLVVQSLMLLVWQKRIIPSTDIVRSLLEECVTFAGGAASPRAVLVAGSMSRSPLRLSVPDVGPVLGKSSILAGCPRPVPSFCILIAGEDQQLGESRGLTSNDSSMSRR
ncbi:hypothetical protein KC338_g197 [Hortaea werneckii]|nr:hypothetical protein KC338_g197 [Hortaea werneckii]